MPQQNNPQTNLNALNGINPLAYLGVNAQTPPTVILKKFNPTDTDTKFQIGTIWINTMSGVVFMLVYIINGTATWAALISSLDFPFSVPIGGTGDATFIPYSVITGGVTDISPLQSVANVGTIGQVLTSGGAGVLPTWTTAAASITLTADTGGPLTSVAGNFDILGDGVYIDTAGAAGTIVIGGTALIPSTFNTDAGHATVATNALTIAGGFNINTAGAGHTVTVDLDAILAGLTSVSSISLVASGNTSTNSLTVTGFGAGVLTSNGAGIIASGAPLSIANGGTNTAAFAHADGIVYYDGTELNTIVAGTDGQVLTGSTGNPPVWVEAPGGYYFVGQQVLAGPQASPIIFDAVGYPNIANYDILYILMENIALSGSSYVVMQLYDGASYINAGYLSGLNSSVWNSNGISNTSNQTGFVVGTAAAAGSIQFNSELTLQGLQTSVLQTVQGTSVQQATDSTFGWLGGTNTITSDITGLQFVIIGGGNFAAGTAITIWGLAL